MKKVLIENGLSVTNNNIFFNRLYMLLFDFVFIS